jgi:hypothetical protein
MADKKISQLLEISQPANTDVLPIVNNGTTKKINYINFSNGLPVTTFVRQNSASWSSGAVSFPAAEMEITSNAGLVNTYNSVEWNAVTLQTNTNIIEADATLNNMILKQTGRYLIDIRYASYDLNNPTGATLRLRLRGQQSTPITTTVGGTLIDTIGDGIVGTSNNAAAQRRGTFILDVNAVPYYIVATFFHTGGTAVITTPTPGTGGFPVFENSYGTRPYFHVIKIS